jgi:hypothetical protein
MAVDVLTAWLERRGFKLNEATPDGQYRYSDGYFVRKVYNWPSDPWTRAAIGYRGGGPNGSKAKLREVAQMLDRLGVEWDTEENDAGFPMVIVTLSDALNGELDDAVEPIKRSRQRAS